MEYFLLNNIIVIFSIIIIIKCNYIIMLYSISCLNWKLHCFSVQNEGIQFPFTSQKRDLQSKVKELWSCEQSADVGAVVASPIEDPVLYYYLKYSAIIYHIICVFVCMNLIPRLFFLCDKLFKKCILECRCGGISCKLCYLSQ